MDILDSIRADIGKIELELEELLLEFRGTAPGDIKARNAYRSQLSRHRRDKLALLEVYHKVNQDISVKNEEILVRIDKMRGVEGEFEDMSGIIEEIYGNSLREVDLDD